SDPAGLRAVFTRYGGSGHEMTAYAAESGAVQITHSSAERLSGTFEFTAFQYCRSTESARVGPCRVTEQAIAGDESRPAREPQTVASIAKLGTVLHKIAPSPRAEGEWIADRIVEAGT
ncbi:MAG: hypothetical protein KY450_03500, partial [Actinobacteria bacterium]|nr:hypothetical protein [Actinomycetota bacterium]